MCNCVQPLIDQFQTPIRKASNSMLRPTPRIVFDAKAALIAISKLVALSLIALIWGTVQCSAQQYVTSQGWPSSNLQREAGTHAQQFWSTMLTKCGNGYYFADNQTPPGYKTSFTSADVEDIVEYVDVTFVLLPPRSTSMAERLDAEDAGLEEAGYAVLLPTIGRSGNMVTQKWGKRVDGPLSGGPSNPFRQSAGDPNATARSLIAGIQYPGIKGPLVVKMHKKKGEWFYDFWGLWVNKSMPQDELTSIAQKGAHINCAGMVQRDSNPKSSVFDLAPSQSPDSPTSAVRAAKIANKSQGQKSEYSADDFTSDLTNILRKAAVDRGLTPDGYDKEIDYIANAVKTCAQITPQLAASVPYNQIHHTELIWYKLGKQFGICQSLAVVGIDTSVESGNGHGSPEDLNHPRNRDVMLKIYQPEGQLWRDGKGFYVSVDILYESPSLLRDVRILQNK